MDEMIDINDFLGLELLEDNQASQDGTSEHPYNTPEEHEFLLLMLESAANDVDSPITDEDVDNFRRNDDLYPILFKVVHHACEDSETPDRATHVVMCSMFSVVMSEISSGSAAGGANRCSLVACHPLTYAAIKNECELPQNSDEFMKSIASHMSISEWIGSENHTTRGLLQATIKAAKRFSRHMMNFKFNHIQLEAPDEGMLQVDFADKGWVRKALTALRQFGSDAYNGNGHRLISHVFQVNGRSRCAVSSRFVDGVLKSLDESRNIAAMELSSIYEQSIYAMALKFMFIITFPSFYHVHNPGCESPHFPSCTFDAPWSHAAARNSNAARMFVRLAVASYSASNVDRIIEVANDSRATNLMDIPEDIWETCIVLPNLVAPVLHAPRKRYCEIPETNTRVELAGIYSGQTITDKNVKLIYKDDLRGSNTIPRRLKHSAYVPRTEHESRLWSEDPSATKLGYLHDVKQLKKINGFIGRLLLVNKTWRDALSKYTFRLKARIDNFSESAGDMQQADFLMGLDTPPLPTLLKSRAVTIALTLERSVPVATDGGNDFKTATQTIPTSTLINFYDQMDLKAIGKDAKFPAEFAKRMNLPGVVAQSIVVAHNNTSAKLEALDDNKTDFLVPVMSAGASTTFSPWTFRCNALITSIAAAKVLAGTTKHVAPLPLAFEVLFSCAGGELNSLAVQTPNAYVVSEKASNEARRITAQKRKQRTERDRSARKAAAGRVLYVEETD
jgi:hypothetical protein